MEIDLLACVKKLPPPSSGGGFFMTETDIPAYLVNSLNFVSQSMNPEPKNKLQKSPKIQNRQEGVKFGRRSTPDSSR